LYKYRSSETSSHNRKEKQKQAHWCECVIKNLPLTKKHQRGFMVLDTTTEM
jgi:hypothetical protein